MSKQQNRDVRWLDDAIEDDYTAAGRFFAMYESQKRGQGRRRNASRANQCVQGTDLLRAAQLTVPKSSDRPTREQIKKIKNGERISPVLLMRVSALKKVVIADGFYRVCAAYRLDPDVILLCKLAGV